MYMYIEGERLGSSGPSEEAEPTSPDEGISKDAVQNML